jgi:hypothetical protein
MDEKIETRFFCRSWDLCILRPHHRSLYVATPDAGDLRKPSRRSTSIWWVFWFRCVPFSLPRAGQSNQCAGIESPHFLSFRVAPRLKNHTLQRNVSGLWLPEAEEQRAGSLLGFLISKAPFG